PELTMPGPTADERPAAASDTPVRMTSQERRATFALASLYGLRMFGLFIILPVFALYAETLPGGSNHALVGLALGSYGLTQALLQIPFGWASDRWGRKRVIVIGLVFFAAGSIVAALAHDISWIIAGRILQGMGAISAAVIALAADLTRDSVRTRTMAAIGMTIGLTFALSIVAAPVLDALVGVPGIFALTAVLAAGAIWVVIREVPDAPRRALAATPDAQRFSSVLRDPVLMRLNFGVFALHASLMSVFVQFPLSLKSAGLAPAAHWVVYLPVMVVSFLLVVPLFARADRRRASGAVTAFALGCLVIGQAAMAWLPLATSWSLALALLLYFAGLNVLEAVLPAAVSRQAPADMRGVATGIYSSLQFLGAFVGAAMGGYLSQLFGPAAAYWFGLGLTLAWAVFAATQTRALYNGDTRTKETPAWPR
ncbi:MAG: MFS transporter, partial [Betaproteobacteria bacterium]